MRRFGLCCLIVSLGACSGTPQIAHTPAAPLPPQPGAAPADAQRQAEAQELEQAEAKCATGGEHAVAQRTAGGVQYTCVPRGEAPPPTPTPNP
jgi:hypothetical protein